MSDAPEPSTIASQLDAARSALEEGNHQKVIDLARGVLQTGDAAEQRSAQQLLDRLQPDPLTKYLLLLTFALLVAVTAFAYFGDH